MYILLQMVLFSTMGVLLKTNNMKISELIKKLQEIQDRVGERPVLVNGYDISMVYYDNIDEVVSIDF